MLAIVLTFAVLGVAATTSTIAPFSATWNVPTAPCADLLSPFDPERFGILTNPGEAMYGPEIVLFFTLGKFPRIESVGGAWINGGVPQWSIALPSRVMALGTGLVRGLFTFLVGYYIRHHFHFPSDDGFTAFWNVPSAACARYNVTLRPEAFNITVNPKRRFNGRVITLFYTLGVFPVIANNGTWINGGVPQNGDLGLHLMDAEIDINNLIPDENFDGLAVIDFEDWRPVWSLTGGTQQKYKDASKDLVRKRHLNWTDRQVEALAKTEYERAGRRFLLSTLELGKQMRPRGKWGYYGYPFVDNYDKGAYNVSSTYRKANDEMSELFSRSTAIYPSIYVLKDNLTSGERALQVQGRINETFRVRKNTAIPIIPYFWYSYHEVIELLAYEDLVSTIGTVYVNGLPGFVIWGGSSEVSSTYKCQRIKNYLDATLGPYVQGLVQTEDNKF